MKRRKITRELREAAVKEYLESDQGAKAIGRKYGVSDMSILSWVKKMPKKENKKLPDEEKREIVAYRLDGHTLRETAQKYQVTEASIRDWEKKFGVKSQGKIRSNVFSLKQEKKAKKRVLRWIQAGSSSGYYDWKNE